jgi:phage terminase large subunit-like protein
MRLQDVTLSDLTRIVVAIDPAVSSNEDSDDTGIVVVARGPHIDVPDAPCVIPHCPGHGYVLEDLTQHAAPNIWAAAAVAAYDRWKADRIVAEANNGGDMIGDLVHAVRAGVAYSKVTATRGKRIRAEPIAALSEQNRIHFLGVFPELESQLNTWDPELTKDSPDRLDAYVWGMTYLGLIGGQGAAFLQVMKDEIEGRPEHQVPAKLKSPRGLELRLASNERTELRAGCKHRFQVEANGIQCVLCGGWQEEAQ